MRTSSPAPPRSFRASSAASLSDGSSVISGPQHVHVRDAIRGKAVLGGFLVAHQADYFVLWVGGWGLAKNIL